VTRPTPIRPWTPDQIAVDVRDGSRTRRLSPKRACNTCGLLLGDLTEVEMVAAAKGRPLLDVDRACPYCQRLHVLIGDPEPRDPGFDPGDVDEVLGWRMLCPNRDDPDRDCFVYDRCGCTPPEGFDPYSIQGQEWLAERCPNSPTGEHVYHAEWNTVDCPKPRSCWHADESEMADELLHTGPSESFEVGTLDPGVYAVAAHLDDLGHADWRLVADVAAHAARRDTKAPAPTG
jgi:hypothetical protein